jgi:hypothetical protein
MNTALQMFRQNNVTGVPLTAAAIGAPNQLPSVDGSLLYFEFLDPNNNDQVVPMGDTRGKVMRAAPGFCFFFRSAGRHIAGISVGRCPRSGYRRVL